ncbi:hypothetical protein EDD85DRAFT_189756 [Armillaria nabsnona]|nr:hypothetical protein EDD85DRAFT_189756 [Armillaria nabsnona]
MFDRCWYTQIKWLNSGKFLIRSLYNGRYTIFCVPHYDPLVSNVSLQTIPEIEVSEPTSPRPVSPLPTLSPCLREKNFESPLPPQPRMIDAPLIDLYSRRQISLISHLNMISSIPTVSFSSINLSVPLPVIRKRQSVATEAEYDPTVPPPIKRSTGSILRAKRLTAVNTISRPFIARRSKSQSPTTTTESDRPFIRLTRSAQSIFKSKEQEPSDDSQPPVATTNKISRVLRSKYQRASIVTTDTMARPVMLVKRSAQSIFRSKKTRDLNRESVVTIQELEDVVSLHPLSVYSPSFPSEEKPETERSESSESSETSSLLSESSPTTSSTPSLAVALEDSIETSSLARVPSVKSAVVVLSESAVPANSFYERYRWMVMILMVIIIGVSSEFLLRRH